jgi:hypothetical protein
VKEEFRFGPWNMIYSPEDGGRIDSLLYKQRGLLTTEPSKFRPPSTDYGEYETRPVYGYDDCFPSVETCIYPGSDWTIPDHGELCWLSWKVKTESDQLVFSVDSKILPIRFTREMYFAEDELTWKFDVFNKGDKAQPFQHVMHPLMPLSEITAIKMPAFGSVFDEIAQKRLNLNHSQEIQTYLLNQPTGSTNMLFLQNIKKGLMSWTYRDGLSIEVTFPEKQFPSIGIWWNNNAYPDEDDCRRNECAFEPIPGDNSRLTDAYNAGRHLSVAANETYSWVIKWRMIE